MVIIDNEGFTKDRPCPTITDPHTIRTKAVSRIDALRNVAASIARSCRATSFRRPAAHVWSRTKRSTMHVGTRTFLPLRFPLSLPQELPIRSRLPPGRNSAARKQRSRRNFPRTTTRLSLAVSRASKALPRTNSRSLRVRPIPLSARIEPKHHPPIAQAAFLPSAARTNERQQVARAIRRASTKLAVFVP